VPWFVRVRCPSREAVQTRILVARSSRLGFPSKRAHRVATVGARVGSEEGPSQRPKRSEPSLESTRPSRLRPRRVQARRGFGGVTPAGRKRGCSRLVSGVRLRKEAGARGGPVGVLAPVVVGVKASSQREERQLEIVLVRRFVLQKSGSRRRARNRKVAEARHRHRV